MRLDTRLLLALNALAPRPNFPERPTPEAYAAWEYDEAARQVELMRAAGVSLDVERALDLGCGLGGKSVYVASHGPRRLMGVDISPRHVRAARAFALARGATRAHFALADAARLPARSGAFDLVVATDTFEHFPRPDLTLAECARVLRPGGRLAAVFGPWGSPLGSHLYDRIFVPWCHVLFPRDALAEALREIARRRGRGRTEAEVAEIRRECAEQIRYYDQDINRMTLRRFRSLLAAEPRLEVVAWNARTPDKLRGLSAVRPLPGLDEYLTGILVMVAERIG